MKKFQNKNLELEFIKFAKIYIFFKLYNIYLFIGYILH